MKVAQGLYEGVDIGGETTGLITYMRTDGRPWLARSHLRIAQGDRERFGENTCPNARGNILRKRRTRRKRTRRSARPAFNRTPERMAKRLDGDQIKLYDLI